MKPPSSDPMTRQARSIDALCADILETRGSTFPRTDALRGAVRAVKGVRS